MTSTHTPCQNEPVQNSGEGRRGEGLGGWLERDFKLTRYNERTYLVPDNKISTTNDSKTRIKSEHSQNGRYDDCLIPLTHRHIL